MDYSSTLSFSQRLWVVTTGVDKGFFTNFHFEFEIPLNMKVVSYEKL
jgi:hypothetical protein